MKNLYDYITEKACPKCGKTECECDKDEVCPKCGKKKSECTCEKDSEE